MVCIAQIAHLQQCDVRLSGPRQARIMVAGSVMNAPQKSPCRFQPAHCVIMYESTLGTERIGRPDRLRRSVGGFHKHMKRATLTMPGFSCRPISFRCDISNKTCSPPFSVLYQDIYVTSHVGVLTDVD
ncbi:hypothetical protein PoB_001065100 [Plakobranchus ocellatus]|uniref:Uncharacterized protein n=1 Tax=Plakobranchus ocellatus TaxID=259542 RepID=A0AAV3YP17_9GAST|nr:hypothetical protein PoB_001065100 [Plakobranchus ocellatus]